ncbi:hypothetical protein RMATCC62417_17710 [Rhizopus microsporus]|nr:hypothetical protein RMATCC62417_17710 [Rhizopus microsporus]
MSTQQYTNDNTLPTTTSNPDDYQQDPNQTSSGNPRVERTTDDLANKISATPRSLSSTVSNQGSSTDSSTTEPPSADSNAFFEPDQNNEQTQMSPGERAKKLEKEMKDTDINRQRDSQGGALFL